MQLPKSLEQCQPREYQTYRWGQCYIYMGEHLVYSFCTMLCRHLTIPVRGPPKPETCSEVIEANKCVEASHNQVSNPESTDI